jgi:hypothetical protein
VWPCTYPNREKIKKNFFFDKFFQHRFWYKSEDDPYGHMHFHRIWRDDPMSQEAWRELERACLHWTFQLSDSLLLHVQKFLGVLHPELGKAQMPSELVPKRADEVSVASS